jgi:site-specific recombinase XerD
MRNPSTSKIRVRFQIRRASTNKIGTCSINCKVTVNRVIARLFSTGIQVNPEKWDSKTQLIKGSTDAITSANRKLNNIRYEIEEIFNTQRSQGRILCAQEITDVYRGKLDLQWPVTRLATAYIEELMCKGRSKGTLNRYNRCYKYLTEYLGADIRASLVDRKHVAGFWRWLMKRGLHNDYCNKIVQACIGLFRFGIREGYTTVNPFEGTSMEWKGEIDLTCLDHSEINLLKNHVWSDKLQRVVDSFLFMCYTGLHISDYIALTPETQYQAYNSDWLKVKRLKTGVSATIPLHSFARVIIEKYGGIQNLPRISGQKSNDYLKLVAETVGIQKNLTNKVARKTFTDMALNDFNMSHESVAEMLGHTSTKQLKHYGSVSERRIFSEWKENAI